MPENKSLNYEMIHQVVKNVVLDIVKKNPNYSSMTSDLIQEGMIKAIEVIDKFNPSKGAKIETFISRCVKNEIINKIKNESTKSKILELISDSEIVDKKHSNIDLSILEVQITNFIENNTLFSEEDKEIITLRMMGCKYEEIAKKIGKNKKYVDNSIQRIKKIITKKFKL